MCDHIPILLLCCAIQVALGADVRGPLVDTKYGKLQGTTLKVKETDRTVDTFYGIPFAKPPVGSLRFAAPEPPKPWKTVRGATKPPSMCLQNVEIFKEILKLSKIEVSLPPTSEDCLYLNVFRPSDRGPNTRLPVMVFIHGGGLAMGTAAVYDCSALSAYENVVCVVIQYRLGMLGFLNTGNGPGASGNYACLDQVAALRWVQENIEDFGGDPRCVTIFGESAGAASVSALVLSPLAKGLFHRAIAQSGVAIMPGLMAISLEELIFYRDLVANESRCEPSSLADCLRKKSEQEIFSIISALDFMPIPACVDGVFLPKNPIEILDAKENNKVPFIIGLNEQEYGWVVQQGLDAEYMNGLDKNSIQLELRRFLFQDEVPELENLVLDEYFGDTDDPLKIRDRFIELQGDFMFTIPILKTAKLHRDSGSPVYFYEFRRRPSLYDDIRPRWVKADQGDDVVFVFGVPFLRDGALYRSHNFPQQEKTLSETVMKYWANFARTGNPNGPGLVRWSQYDKNGSYLQIDIQQKAAQRFKERKFNFWNKTFSEKARKMMEAAQDLAVERTVPKPLQGK